MIVGLVIGVVAYVFSSAMFVFYEGLPVERLIPLTFILILPALGIGLAIAPTLMFSIHIVGDWVEHRMIDKWVLSRAQTSNFRRMDSPAGMFAAILQFSDGTKLRFFGAHRGILASLNTELRQRMKTAEQGVAPQSATRSEFDFPE